MSLNPGDTAWVLVSTALVQLMTPGLSFFYAGLVNSRNVVGTLMLSYGAMGVVTFLWVIIGYSEAFGPSTNTHVTGGTENRALEGLVGGMVGDLPALVYAMFQLMFAIVTAAIISGSVATRMRFIPFMTFVALWHLLVYCPLTHWVWTVGDGWINDYGAIDFAGGLVVHVSSGVSAFVAAFWLGQNPLRDNVHEHKPHNVPYVMLGAALLWFGWFGFNAGSALTAGQLAGLAFANTQIAAAVAMFTWNLVEVICGGKGWFNGRPTAVGAAIGAVVGLVAITPAAGFVTPMWSIFFGAFTSPVCYLALKLTKRSPIDDTLDTFAVHGVGGAVGSLLTGLFATTEVGSPVDGSFYGDGGELFGKQIVALLATIALCLVMTSLIMLFLKGMAKLLHTDIRISADDMAVGVDGIDHGESAYGHADIEAVIAALQRANQQGLLQKGSTFELVPTSAPKNKRDSYPVTQFDTATAQQSA
ncbi:ammonium transporter [Capsaspora owczarzaki ATCC 30864]|uniref:Ammonium transporter n=1 Tax=Capsaspora owczarzaki (strain ATCC 30864) TaxID=595528 RepID=A0A0D2UPA8_CAPO3|nr:ammonium transporter [Capsaspora owczarzaki ATCC 30864]KJE96841.1 ammonium transporter [Capsaspora owczarzaki ATCC 30864]|eukprot:XP_004343826.2 ammonium transporter [Capsaspora owczarzaki ATCC 30864]